MQSRVMSIVIDGGCIDLIKPWIKENKLSNMAKLFKEGCVADLQSEFPPLTFLNNPSMLTGKNAGKHGITNWLKRKGETSLSIVDETSIKEKFIWDILGEHGKKSIIINMPLTYPPRRLNGIMISRSIIPPLKRNYIYPEYIEREIEENVGKYYVFQEEIYGEGKEEKFFKSVCIALERRCKAAIYLLEKYPWDLFMLGISAVDAIQHAFWKHMDPSHPQYNRKEAEKYKDYIYRIYERVDQSIGQIREIIGEETTFFILSDHGAGPLYGRTHTNNLLMDMGLLNLKDTPLTKLKFWLFKKGFTVQNLYHLAIRMGLVNMRKKMDPRIKNNGIVRRVCLSWNDIDWSKTKAFVFGTGGQIFIRPKKGDSREELIHCISEKLLQVKIPLTGEKYVDKVYRREELFWGERINELPDLLFYPADMRYEESGDYEFYSNKLFDKVIGISGNHRLNALFVMAGEKIKKGFYFKKKVKMYDIAAIFLSLFNIQSPPDMDGKAVKEIFR